MRFTRTMTQDKDAYRNGSRRRGRIVTIYGLGSLKVDNIPSKTSRGRLCRTDARGIVETRSHFPSFYSAFIRLFPLYASLLVTTIYFSDGHGERKMRSWKV